MVDTPRINNDDNRNISKKLPNTLLIEYIDLVKEEQPSFVVEFCQAIQKRKNELLEISMKTLGFDPFPDDFNTHTPTYLDPIKYRFVQKVTKILLGDAFSITSTKIIDSPVDILPPVEQELNLDLNQTDLQKIEDLKKEYSHFNKDYLNSLVSSLQSIVDEIKDIDRLKLNPNEEKIRKAEVLKKYGLKKWLGERAEGIRPIQFVEKYYKKWLDAGVLFKASLRTLDKELVAVFRDRHTLYDEHNPLITDTQRTEMLAAGIIGNTEQQKKAQRLIIVRPDQRRISALLRV